MGLIIKKVLSVGETGADPGGPSRVEPKQGGGSGSQCSQWGGEKGEMGRLQIKRKANRCFKGGGLRLGFRNFWKYRCGKGNTRIKVIGE